MTGLVETRDCPEYVDNIFADLRSYNVFRKLRDRHGGGVALVAKKTLRGYRRTDLEPPDLEMLFVDLNTANVMVCVFYSPPSSVRTNTARFIEHVRSLPHDVIRRLIVIGDFNVPDINWTPRTASTIHGIALLHATREFLFKQLVTFPTRLNNTLDLAFISVSIPVDQIQSISAPAEKCDHLAFEFRALIKRRNSRLIIRQRWKFNVDAHVSFRNSLENINWHNLLAGKTAHQQAVIFEETVLTTTETFHRLVYMKQRVGQVSYPSFVTKAIRRRDRAFRKWKCCPAGPQRDWLRQKWKKHSRFADLKAAQYEQHHIMQAATSTRDPKKFWKLVKSTADVQSVPPLWNGQKAAFEFDDRAKSNMLNSWFVSCQQESPLPATPSFSVNHLNVFPEPVTGEEIVAAIKQVLVPGKASGPFLLSPDLLSHCGSSIFQPLIILFNTCIFTGVFPDCWKTSYVTAIPKGSLDATQCSNWRPISLLHPLSKLLEAVVARRLRIYLETNSLLSPHQYGFRQKRSTELLTTVTVQEWMDALAEGYMVDAVFLDCQKAFDRADHQLVIQSLLKLEVSPVFLNFFSDYLRGRRQVTVVDGMHSAPLAVTSGVPQGSILGPLLFLCFVDSVTNRPSPATAIRIYADDIALYRIIRSSTDEAEFQADLDTVANWATEARLAFNTTESVFVRFSGKQTIPEPPKYSLAEEEIPRKNSVKYSGLHLDSRLTWKEHVDNTVTKALKRIRYITFLFNRKCQRARITLFNSLVLPLFDYCSVVYCPRLKGLIDDLEGCVRAFLRSICLGPAPEDSSIGRYSSRLRQLEMEPLILKKIKVSLVLAYKMLIAELLARWVNLCRSASVTSHSYLISEFLC